MKVNAFKKLIKEAVREAVGEALNEVLNHPGKSLVNEMKTFSFTSDDVVPDIKDIRSNLAAKMFNNFGTPGNLNNGQQHYALSNKPGPFNAAENPLASFLNDSANNMTSMDVSGLK